MSNSYAARSLTGVRVELTKACEEIDRMRVEIRRLRAENARQKELLKSVVTFADEAWGKWDSDEDMRVGKMLVALAGHCPGYRPDTDAIHAELKRSLENPQP